MTSTVMGSSLISGLLFWATLMTSPIHGAQAFQPLHLAGTKLVNKPMVDINPRTGLSASLSANVQEAEVAEALDWSFVDGVYLITCPNADSDGERISQAKSILASSGLLDRVEVKEFDTDDEDRIRGCYTSHISVLKDIQAASSGTASSKPTGPFGDFFGMLNQPKPVDEEQGDFVALVIEDNLALSGGDVRQSKLAVIEDFCQSGQPWDMVHLSYIPYVPGLTVSRTNKDGIVKLSCGIGSALGTTAYIINSKATRTILDHDAKNGFYAPIPDVMAELFPETRYALNPTLFVRAPTTSSLVNPQLDDLRSLLFQPAVAAFAQNLLVVTGLSTNALLPIIIVLLLAASAASSVVTFDAIRSLVTTGTLNVPIFLPLASSVFSLLSLAIIVQGALLAPKPPAESPADT